MSSKSNNTKYDNEDEITTKENKKRLENVENNDCVRISPISLDDQDEQNALECHECKIDEPEEPVAEEPPVEEKQPKRTKTGRKKRPATPKVLESLKRAREARRVKDLERKNNLKNYNKIMSNYKTIDEDELINRLSLKLFNLMKSSSKGEESERVEEPVEAPRCQKDVGPRKKIQVPSPLIATQSGAMTPLERRKSLRRRTPLISKR